MKKVILILLFDFLGSGTAAMEPSCSNQEWVIFVPAFCAPSEKKEIFDLIDGEARESLKNRYVRGYESANHWMIIIKSINNVEEIRTILRRRPWFRDALLIRNSLPKPH